MFSLLWNRLVDPKQCMSDESLCNVEQMGLWKWTIVREETWGWLSAMLTDYCAERFVFCWRLDRNVNALCLGQVQRLDVDWTIWVRLQWLTSAIVINLVLEYTNTKWNCFCMRATSDYCEQIRFCRLYMALNSHAFLIVDCTTISHKIQRV